MKAPAAQGAARLRLPRSLPWLLALACLPALAQAPATKPASAPALSSEALHEVTVQRGDTLIGIARRWLAEPRAWRALARLNRLRNPNLILPGQVLQVPWALMQVQEAPATVVLAHGAVRERRGAELLGPVRDGQPLPEGAGLQTAEDASATVRLVDGTLLRLRGGSQLQVEQARRIPAAQVTPSGVRLEQGRIEVEAAKPQGGKPGFRVTTPQGILAVRGTEFRVAVTPGQTRGEVLEGLVQAQAASGAAGPPSTALPVAALQGTLIEAGRAPTPARALPSAPDVGGLPTLHERLVVRLRPTTSAPAGETSAWRGQLAAASDARFDRPLAEQRVAADAELRFAGLEDGEYQLRLRRIDAQGFESPDARLSFRLKARPEPPLLLQPAAGAVVIGPQLQLEWTEQAQAERYRVQLARDERFTQPLREGEVRGATRLGIDGLAPGSYHWRARSVRTLAGADDLGPWGDARSFELKLPPPAPAAKPPEVGSRGVQLSWTLEAGQSVDLQLAGDAAFTRLQLERRTREAGLALPLPPPGRWYLRLRSIDADGFVGPWGATQSFEVLNCVRDASGDCVRGTEQVLISP